MTGTYKYDDCIVEDPNVTVITLFKNYATNETIVKVLMEGGNVGIVNGAVDGVNINISNIGNSMPQSTSIGAIKNWAENYLQQFKQI